MRAWLAGRKKAGLRMSLIFQRYIDLPRHERGGYDHADVDETTSRVFLAHTALGQVEILDGGQGRHTGSVKDCAEASGVLMGPESGVVFAAARGSGQVLVLEASSGQLLHKIEVGPRPNGLAWDGERRRLLVADVEEYNARLFEVLPDQSRLLAITSLAGRPRWCVFDRGRDLFWVNIAEPALVMALAGDDGRIVPEANLAVACQGPHGLAMEDRGGRLLVACDSGEVVKLDPESGNELGRLGIAGPPDVVWYNSKCQYLYVAIGKPGVVEVVKVADMSLVEEIRTEEGAHTLTFDRERQLLYGFLPRSNRAVVYQELGEARG